ncbi:hypothetical protein CIRMBP1284_01816 [Enterococcus cecorum]|uniref:Uncharacterized protein n=1 Tax=Enterococcus cecorum TaxID=44008 RepID=A0A1Y4QYC7_9ENTE|nr:hypothetical protein B5E88_07690 [Enterococcus cecorum]CAI3254332.1 hypothetical protein CIRMBP1261_00044 [Enterococcus cecorum]CAI3291553.1 hypothetical protein CIRMBP1252_00577 [Enterococcus cecorum]CAI3305333.1 hypothetical protein CIRMBP1249_00576 [Enterococcus cecorum]CAI3306192.1 hypothetical protein CIRMBP1227_00620 [Enterococcus cecorum]
MLNRSIHEIVANVNLTLFFQSLIMLYIQSYRFERYLFSKITTKLGVNFLLFFALYQGFQKLNLLPIKMNSQMYMIVILFTGGVIVVNYFSVLSHRFYFVNPKYFIISVIILFIILMSYYYQI